MGIGMGACDDSLYPDDKGATRRLDLLAKTARAPLATLPGARTRTLIRADLVDAVYRACPALSRAEARDLLEMMLAEIAEALVRGEAVKLCVFGRFAVRAKKARTGRNPRTGTPAPITPRRVLSFRPSRALLAAITPTPRRSHPGFGPGAQGGPAWRRGSANEPGPQGLGDRMRPVQGPELVAGGIEMRLHRFARNMHRTRDHLDRRAFSRPL